MSFFSLVGRFPVSVAIPATGILLSVAACSDGTGPTEHPLFEPTASARWNAIARDLVIKYRTDPPMASRFYALVSVGQDRAVTAALGFVGAGPRVLDHAAAVGASAAVLTYAYPSEAALIDSLARADLGNPLWSADPLVNVAAGDSVGRAIAAELIAERSTDGSGAVWTGTIPTGPGMWFSSLVPPQPPLRPLWGTVRPWLMAHGDQFRPESPPAFGSSGFQAALAEVRQYSDSRTQRELDIATHWGDGAGTYTPPGHWNRIAADLVIWYNLTERDVARVLAVLNRAMMDAGIAVWDAKYTYWLLRPSQAEPAITTPVGLPNFPSYVSGHSGFSGAASEVLGYFFPEERARLREQAEEAAMSRLYGGIHFRFDNEVGLRMGRAVGAIVIDHERSRGSQTFQRWVALGGR
ncbi:MAG TPA: vanadium-dependent haloperoxidase [Gemmatimonadales bacterium]